MSRRGVSDKKPKAPIRRIGAKAKEIKIGTMLSINVPLIEALEQIPGYVKFMKDMVTKKRSSGEIQSVSVISYRVEKSSEIHVITREMVYTAMLLKYLSIYLVDTVIAKYAKFKFGNLTELGIPQPEEGPFSVKISTTRSPLIDVGAIDKIKHEQIMV
ncbi:probable indole-3-pyruvate monooxygenase YUCCA10 [Solanum pennellii]|uniref:Probable indole-3-pyruvate monooxygenase YUCCA10 n=1 Tax=Solanum pennellii TaxID=28526 RepID=A0ABM1G1K9_SOLPN|nr:probable indole-3-pyruvate monooxygenase YUCCA10 [Solanum pennellii]